MSRSTASTSKPSCARKRAWRPVPQARSSTAPPGRIQAAQRLTQAEGVASRCACMAGMMLDLVCEVAALKGWKLALAMLAALAGLGAAAASIAAWLGDRHLERTVVVRVVPVPFTRD